MIKKDIQDYEQADEESSLQSLTERAYGYLARREHSARELAGKLEKHGPSTAVWQVVDRLQKRGEQSDTRFAEMLCRSRFNSGKGPVRLLHELKQHDIDDDIVTAVMLEYEDHWSELAERVRAKKFGAAAPASMQEWSRQARFLQQRGFSVSHFDRYEE